MTPEDWIVRLAPLDRWNERIMLAAFALFGIPASLLDLGSGTGAMANIARRLGVDAWGVDQVPREEEHLLQMDVATPIHLGRSFEWVTCLEVAEHLTPAGAQVLLDTIETHLAPGGLCLFSAAAPGQGGDEHETLRAAYLWRSDLDARGLSYRKDWSARLALMWTTLPAPMMWLPANIQVFERARG